MKKDTYNVFPENTVLSELLASSGQFKLFYNSNRHLIKKSIYWALDTTLLYGINAAVTRYSSGENIIRLRRLPAILEDAFTIAHELEHLVLDEEGFVVTYSKGKDNDYETLSWTLNDMILDPLVNSRLEVYGFDLRKAYDRVASEGIKMFQKLPKSRTDRITRTQWLFQLVELMLEYEVAYKSCPNPKLVKAVTESKHQELIEDVKELTDFVKERGYDTPDKQKELVNEIIHKYSLEKFVSS